MPIIDRDLRDFAKKHTTSMIPDSIWFYFDKYRVYLRAGRTQNYGPQIGIIRAITISNVEVDESFRNKGIFSELVLDLHELAKELGYGQLQIENAFSPIVQGFCKRNHFLEKHSNDWPPCFYINIEGHHP